jgi:hypothetical protein
MREKPPILGVVEGNEKGHALTANGFLQQADDITLRAHAGGAPLGILSVPHTEAIMMFADRTCKSSAGFFEQFRPLVRIELLSCEHGDEVFIPKL